MERKELSNNNRELWRGSNSDARNKDIPGYNSVPTTGVLSIPDHWEGYECLLSDDLFTVLALDMWSHEDIDDETVEQHFSEINRFLSNLIQLKDGGIEFQDKYPKLNLELAKRRVKEAFTRLETFRKRRDYYKEVLEEKKRVGRERLEMVITTIIADDKVTLEESLEFIELATSLYFTEAEAAGILLEAIVDRGFKPCKPLKPEKSQLYKLLSTEFERELNSTSSKSQTNYSTFIQSPARLSVEDLLGMGIIEEFLSKGGKTEGKEWLEFYKSLKEDFNIESISELKSLLDSKSSPVFKSELLNMVQIQGGTFLMGATPEQGEDATQLEQPSHTISLDSYYIGTYLVSQSEWEKVMGSNPANFKGSDFPVEQVSWYDVIDFCNRLSDRENLQRAYTGAGDNIKCDFTVNGYRLPTEAEWEYAARGGNKNRRLRYSGSDNLDSVGWYDKNSGRKTNKVGEKFQNELGIFDMSGNVWEWCWDWHGNYGSSAQTNPRGPHSGSCRVVRGGSWDNLARSCRVASRIHLTPDYQSNIVGFRVARTK